MLLHSAEEFLAEKTELNDNSSIPSTELNKLYEEWCRINNVPTIGRNDFYKYVRDYSKKIRYSKVDSPNGRVNGFVGLKIKSPEEENTSSEHEFFEILIQPGIADNTNK